MFARPKTVDAEFAMRGSASTNYFIAAAKRVLSKRLPGLTGFIETLPCVVSEHSPGVAASARGVIYINPRMADEDPLLLPYCILREAAQILLNHAERRARMNAPTEIWSEAARMALYCLFRRSLGAWSLYDLAHKIGLYPPNLLYDQPTEYYASELMKRLSRECSRSGGGEKDKDMDEADGTGDSAGCDDAPASGAQPTAKEEVETVPLDARQSGSAEDGEPRPWESEEVERQVALPACVRQAKIEEAISHLRGLIGSDIDRLVGRFTSRNQGAIRLLRLIRPSVEFGRSVHSDFNYDRPSRRSQCSDVTPRIILPRFEGRSHEAAILVDTSGSICDSELERVAKLICAMNSIRSGKFHLFSGDTEIKTSLLLHKGAEAIRFSGGGGTRVDQMMLAVAQKITKRPLQLFIFTDAETPWADRKELPGVDVTAILVRKYHSPVPNWIKVRYLDEFWPEME